MTLVIVAILAFLAGAVATAFFGLTVGTRPGRRGGLIDLTGRDATS